MSKKENISVRDIESYLSHWIHCQHHAKSYDVTTHDDSSITIKLHKVPTFVERIAHAHVILSECDLALRFFYQDNVIICVIMSDYGPNKVGYAICKESDRYSEAIGKAIAFERARYGKVIHTDLLGEEE